MEKNLLNFLKVLIGQCSTVSSHSHTRGTMDITGVVGLPLGGSEYSGAFFKTFGTYEGSVNSTGNYKGIVQFKASNNWTGSTSVEGNGYAYSLNVSAKMWLRSA